MPLGVHPRCRSDVLDHRRLLDEEAIADVHIVERVLQPGMAFRWWYVGLNLQHTGSLQGINCQCQAVLRDLYNSQEGQ